MPRSRMREVQLIEKSPLMDENTYEGRDDETSHVLNHAKFDELNKKLRMPAAGVQPPRKPASSTDGELFGWMLHQGKYRGSWKKAYFVLKGAYLFQYAKETSPAPKKAFYVSYCLSEKMAAEALAEETSAKYMVKLEEKACSLRINVYSPDKVKVLSATSEATMNQWVEAMDACVKASCEARPGLLEEKAKAAEAIKPLMLAQSFAEVDQYHTLISNLVSAGLINGDDDPRHSDNIAKAGKMKMLKSTMDENVWQKFYFVLVDKTIYYYKSRHSSKANYDKKDDDEEEEEEEEDESDMPWKGCFNVTVATVDQAPTAISTKAKVFQIKTPLRTFILKARHEVDADEWMSHICAAQQGIPVDSREAKMRGFNVYEDILADKISAQQVPKLMDVLKHPVGVRFMMQYLHNVDASLAKLVKAFKSIEKYKSKVVPAKKHKKALKIFKKFVKGNEHVPKPLQAELATQVEEFDFAAQNMFMPLERHLLTVYEAQFEGFLSSEIYQTLKDTAGPKKIIVSKEKQADKAYGINGTINIGRSRDNESGDGYIHLGDDHKVSREHARIDAGPLAVLVTDLGSSKGTRLGSKDGKKVMTKIIMPGQSLHIGGYVLTYELGSAPMTGGKASKKGGMFGGMFGKKK